MAVIGLVAFLLLLACCSDLVVSARAPALVPGFCSSSLDCSLNGDCVKDRCVCDAAWHGPTCDVLSLIPAQRASGYWNESEASWGGNPVYDSSGEPLRFPARSGAPAKFHMAVAQMADACGLADYGTNSFVAHVSSDRVEGPYQFEGTLLPPFSHNPQILVGPDSSFYLYHIGGASGSSPVKNCSSRSTNPRNDKHAEGAFVPASNHTQQVNVARAKSLAGPWTHHSVAIEMPAEWAGIAPAWLCSVSNPAPLFARDGSVFLAVVAGFGCGKGVAPTGGGEQVAVARARSWRGPFTWVSKEPAIGGEVYRAEDPFLWESARGFHILAHGLNIYSLNGGRYAYSEDGLNWTASFLPAYSVDVSFTDGSHEIFERRERPKLVMAPAKNGTAGGVDFLQPAYLVTGVRSFFNDMTHTLFQEIRQPLSPEGFH